MTVPATGQLAALGPKHAKAEPLPGPTEAHLCELDFAREREPPSSGVSLDLPMSPQLETLIQTMVARTEWRVTRPASPPPKERR